MQAFPFEVDARSDVLDDFVRGVGRNQSANLSSEIFLLFCAANPGVDVAYHFRLGWGRDPEELLDLSNRIGSFTSWESEGLNEAF